MDIAIIALAATVVAFRITRMTTGKQAAAPLDRRKFLTYLGIMAALLGYCLVAPLLRSRGASEGGSQARLAELTVRAEGLRVSGRASEAVPVATEALSIAERTYGKDHPEVAFQENTLGALYADLGQLEKAESLYRTALSKTERFVGRIPPVLPVVLDNLATLCERTDRKEEAARLRERAKGYRPGR